MKVFHLLILILLLPAFAFAEEGKASNSEAFPNNAVKASPKDPAGKEGPSAVEAFAENAATGGNNPNGSAAESDSSPASKELDDISKEMSNFQGQAEQMMKQLEKAVGTATQNGGQANALDIARQKAMRLAADDRFLKSATDLWAHPDRNKMLLIQLGFFLFMIILKAWRQSKSTHWFKRMIVGFFFNLLTMIGVGYVIPLILLGEPFAVFTGTLFKVLFYGGP